MNVAYSPADLSADARAVAIGTFDGVHLGHKRVIDAALAAGPMPTVVTFDPHPRIALGNQVELLTTLERRLELFEALGIADTLVIEFTPDTARLEPEEFVDSVLRPIGTQVLVAGENFRFGRARSGDLDLLAMLGFDVRPVPLVEHVSSTQLRHLLRAGEIERAATLLGRPPELDGTVVTGDARGGTLGFPTANLSVDPQLLVPAYGIYAGAVARRVPPSRSAPTRTTAATSGASKCSCSTSRATCTAGGSWSSCGSGSGTSGPSRASRI